MLNVGEDYRKIEGVDETDENIRQSRRALNGQPIKNPYALAVAWTNADPRVRVRRTRSVANDFKRIALLPRTWGEQLDMMGVTYRQLRWLAGATGAAYVAARLARYDALVKLLQAPDPYARRGRAFEELARRMPKVRRVED